MQKLLGGVMPNTPSGGREHEPSLFFTGITVTVHSPTQEADGLAIWLQPPIELG